MTHKPDPDDQYNVAPISWHDVAIVACLLLAVTPIWVAAAYGLCKWVAM